MFKRAPRLLLALVCVAGSATIANGQDDGRVEQIPNSVKYRNSGGKPATGRAGSASLEARALIAKDGSMVVEASPGSVDAGAGPGEIVKTQVKIGDFTKNYTQLSAGGYWWDTFAAASRGSAVQVQANVRGIDPKRTGVVTVTTPALLRRDIAVDAVNGPAEQAPHALVAFQAVVSEKNGDLGGTANCVLSVDGVDVDTAEGIWVDAGDTVSCHFSRAFAEPGTYAIAVTAAGVAPHDWDVANNKTSTTITIVDPETPVANGYMYAEYRDTDAHDTYWREAGYQYNYFSEGRTSIHKSYAELWGWSSVGASLMQQLDATLFVDGAIEHRATLAPTYRNVHDDGNYFSNCGEYYFQSFDGTRFARSADRVSMCSSGYHGNQASHRTNYFYQRVVGTVTYLAREGYCSTYGCQNTYYWNNDELFGSGAPRSWAAGSSIRLALRFLDHSGAVHTADRSVTLEDHSAEVNYSGQQTGYDCWSQGYYSRSWKSSGQYAWGMTSWNQ